MIATPSYRYITTSFVTPPQVVKGSQLSSNQANLGHRPEQNSSDSKQYLGCTKQYLSITAHPKQNKYSLQSLFTWVGVTQERRSASETLDEMHYLRNFVQY